MPDHTEGRGRHHHQHRAGHRHSHTPRTFGHRFLLGVAINSAYVIAEVIWGALSHSLALIADAGHNLSDILALICAWGAAVMSQRKSSEKFTYGLRKSSILSALLNAIILMVVTGGIIWEAVLRFRAPAAVSGGTVIIVASLGILVNGFTAFMFMHDRKEDMNIQGVFLHMTTDALMSLTVVITGFVILYTGYTWFDPAASLLVSVIIIAGTWSLLRDSLNMTLDGVPPSIARQEVERYLRSLPEVTGVHDLHIWAMSTTETALTAHLICRTLQDTDRLLKQATHHLEQYFNIGHTTLQIESACFASECQLARRHAV